MSEYLIDMIPDVEKPEVPLVGMDGNATAIIARVRAAWEKKQRDDIVEEYTERATSGDYANVINISMQYIQHVSVEYSRWGSEIVEDEDEEDGGWDEDEEEW